MASDCWCVYATVSYVVEEAFVGVAVVDSALIESHLFEVEIEFLVAFSWAIFIVFYCDFYVV